MAATGRDISAAAATAAASAAARASLFFFIVAAPLRRPSIARRRVYRSFVIVCESTGAVTRESLISSTAAGILDAGKGKSDDGPIL